MVSPFALHQQQIAMLAQQPSLLMTAAAQAANGASKSNVNIQQPGLNDTNMPTQNWPSLVYQIPGLTMPSAGQNELPKSGYKRGQKLEFFANIAGFLPGENLYLRFLAIVTSHIVGIFSEQHRKIIRKENISEQFQGRRKALSEI